MESEGMKENEVSEPLQHLLSLKWDTLPDISTVTKDVQNNTKPLKLMKKVRFSDEVEQAYLEFYDCETDTSAIIDEYEYDVPSLSDNEFAYHESNVDIKKNSLDFTQNEDSEIFLQNSLQSEHFSSDNKVTEHNKELFIDKIILNNNKDNNINDTHNNSLNSENIFRKGIKNLDKLNLDANKSNAFYPEDHIVEEIASIQISNISSTILKYNLDNEHCTIKTRQENKYKNATSPLNETNSSKKLNSQKQTEKINTLLEKSEYKFSSVPEMKSKVVEAWSSVKKKQVKQFKNPDTVQKVKKLISTEKDISNNAYVLWKKSKLKKRKTNPNKGVNQCTSIDVQQKVSKADEEEKEMVFKLWKKQKDSMLKQETEKKNREIEDKNISLLMSQQIKKEDAESAYLAWIAHKAEVFQKEELKKRWMLQKNKEVEKLQIQKDKEALEIYNLWLENKYSEKNNVPTSVQNRPPWIPHGK